MQYDDENNETDINTSATHYDDSPPEPAPTIPSDYIMHIANIAGKQYNISPYLIAGIAAQEPGNNLVTPAISQDEYGKKQGNANADTLVQTILGTAQDLRRHLDNYDNDLPQALAAYHNDPYVPDSVGSSDKQFAGYQLGLLNRAFGLQADNSDFTENNRTNVATTDTMQDSATDAFFVGKSTATQPDQAPVAANSPNTNLAINNLHTRAPTPAKPRVSAQIAPPAPTINLRELENKLPIAHGVDGALNRSYNASDVLNKKAAQEKSESLAMAFINGVGSGVESYAKGLLYDAPMAALESNGAFGPDRKDEALKAGTAVIDALNIIKNDPMEAIRIACIACMHLSPAQEVNLQARMGARLATASVVSGVSGPVGMTASVAAIAGNLMRAGVDYGNRVEVLRAILFGGK